MSENSMRDIRGSSGTCFPEGKGEGEDSDQLPCRLKRTQKESPGPSNSSSWIRKPAVDENGNPQNETLSLEMKNDLNEVNLLLSKGDKVFPCLKESVRRNSASPAAQSKAVDLFFDPAEERLAGVSWGVQAALGRDWLAGGPRATDSRRGQCHKGGPWGSGLQCHQQLSEVGISKDEPPSAFVERQGSELEPACPHLVLSTLPNTCPEVFLSDETECVSPGYSKPMLSEQTVEYKKRLPSVQSTSNYLQIILRLLALQAFEVAKPLCHS